MGKGTSTKDKLQAALKEIVVTLLVAALVLGVMRMWQGSDLLQSDGTMTAPEIALLGMDGEKTSLSELRGKPVLLHFWAPW